MDNRRVFRSYKKRSREESGPYSTSNRARGGIINKVKQFFANEPNSNEAEEATSTTETGSNASIKPFSYPETTIRTPLKTSGVQSHNQESPNKVLLKFFQDKGDKPLTEVELEGVKSLLSKTTNKFDSSLVFSKKNEDTSTDTINDKSAIAKANQTAPPQTSITPYNQTILRNGDGGDSFSVFSTPDYRPIYHTINNSFTSRNIPSVKRVYQFSGLPSPYRTRIRAPALKSKKPHRIMAHAQNSTINNNNSSFTTKPISNAANALLNILDGNANNTTVDSEADDTLKKFSNPYASSQSIKKRKHPSGDKLELPVNSSSTPTKKKSTIITADDINKTIAFDKSESLPSDEHKAKHIKLSKPEETSLFGNGSEKKLEQKPLFSVNEPAQKTQEETKKVESKPPTLNGFNFKPPPTQSNLFGSTTELQPSTNLFGSKELKPSTNLFGATKEVKPSTQTNLFGSTTELKPLFGSQPTVPSQISFQPNVSSQPLFDSAPSQPITPSLLSPPKSFSNGVKEANGEKLSFVTKLTDDLLFPEVETLVAKLDPSKVELYKTLFEF